MEIESVKALEVPNGEWYAVVRIPGVVTENARDAIENTLSACWKSINNPPKRTIILQAGMELEIIRHADAAAE